MPGFNIFLRSSVSLTPRVWSAIVCTDFGVTLIRGKTDMRILVPTLVIGLLSLAAPAPALAQAETARAVADMIRDLNSQIAEANAEFAKTGDYNARKARIDPLVNSLKNSMPGAAHDMGREATEA